MECEVTPIEASGLEMCFGRGLIALVGIAFLSCVCFTRTASAEHRLAFVVGINAYSHLGADAQLQRAVADAESVGDSLTRLGFTVTKMARDSSVNQDQFLKRFSAWTKDIEPGDTALFYFAGHGVGIAGTNYLAPADMPDLADADEFLFRAHAISETEIRSRIQNRGAGVTVMMLDACRNNPFRSSDRSIALSRGLEPIESTMGVLTIYAAGYGQTALDRLSDVNDPDPNSLFTRVLLSEMTKPGVSLLDLSENVREKVARLAHSAGHDQVPAVDNQLLGGRSVFLAGPASAAATIVPSETLDEVAWRYIRQTTDTSLLNRFISEYPESRHRSEATALLMQLEKRGTPNGSDQGSDSPLQAAEPHRPVVRPSVDEVTWSQVSSSDDPQKVRDFLERFPQSTYRSAAEERLRQLDTAAWSLLDPRSSNALKAYTGNFPNGIHYKEAVQSLANFESPNLSDDGPRSLPVLPPSRSKILPPFTLGIAVGSPSDLDSVVAKDFTEILQTGQETGPKGQMAVNLLPVPGLNGEQTIVDLLSRSGADLGVLPISILEQIGRDTSLGDLRKKLAFINILPSQDILILAKDPDIVSVFDLANKPVFVGSANSNEDLISKRIFDIAEVMIKPVHDNSDTAINQLEDDKVAAIVVISSPGTPIELLFGKARAVSNLHLASVPSYRFNGRSLLHVKLTHEDFPEFVPFGVTVDSIAASFVLMTADTNTKSQHYSLLENFVRLIFGRWNALSGSGQKSIWRDTELTTILPGWTRFTPAEQWVSRNYKVTQPATARVNP